VPIPPPRLSYIAVIEPSLSTLLLVTMLSSFLVPILVVLFYSSSPVTRMKPIFLMNVVTIVLALALGAIDITLQTKAILAMPTIRPLQTALTCLMILAPFCAELVLILRVIAVYPARSVSWSTRLLVYSPIAVLKAARIANIVVCVVKFVHLSTHAQDFSQTGQTAWNLPYVKVEWFLQLIDMAFVSVLFLARLHRSTSCEHKPTIPTSRTSTRAFRITLSSRVRTLFWIAASNLIFPVLLNLIELVYIFRDSSFLHGTYVYFVNIHVQIIGVLLTTIWSTAQQ
ncbi:hypothetical protein C8Q70DRAFT_887464, partial [Cubamyces menziesii]